MYIYFISFLLPSILHLLMHNSTDIHKFPQNIIFHGFLSFILFIYLFMFDITSFIFSFLFWLIHLFIYIFIYIFIHPLTYLFIFIHIHSLIHLFIYSLTIFSFCYSMCAISKPIVFIFILVKGTIWPFRPPFYVLIRPK